MKNSLPQVDDKDPVYEAADALVVIEKEIKALVDANPETFARYATLQAQACKLKEKLKNVSRPKSVVGITKLLLKTSAITVKVVGKRPAISYDVKIAKNTWPKNVLDVVMVEVIDAKKAIAMIKLEQLDPVLAVSAEIKKAPPTPTVLIKLLK